MLHLVYCQPLNVPNGGATYNKSPVNGQYPGATLATYWCHAGYDVRYSGSVVCDYFPPTRAGYWDKKYYGQICRQSK